MDILAPQCENKMFGTCPCTWRNQRRSQELAAHMLSSVSFLKISISVFASLLQFPISELSNRVYSWSGQNLVSKVLRWLQPSSSGSSQTHKNLTQTNCFDCARSQRHGTINSSDNKNVTKQVYLMKQPFFLRHSLDD